MREPKHRREAIEKLPAGFYVLEASAKLLPNDLVWNWTSREWLRADSPKWLFSPLVYSEDIICAARKVELSDYAADVTARRSFVIRK